MKSKEIGIGIAALAAVAIIAIVVFIGNSGVTPVKVNITDENGTVIQIPSNASGMDDWNYSTGDIFDSLSKGVGGVQSMAAPSAAAESLGFAVGGAMDINNFRENIKNDYLPIPTDLTYEGLFYGYYFDTGQTEECNELFCPSYSYAIAKDPFAGDDDYYLSVGLNSGMTEDDFERKKLNLVIVLDISGSMSSSFNTYYYDQFGNQNEVEKDPDAGKSKMQIANEAVVDLTKHLKSDDRFGVVLFDNGAYLAKPLGKVGNANMDSIRGHIMELTPRGGTYMEGGLKLGTKLFEDVVDADKSEYENRIIFLTDAMPNIGDTSEEGLMGMTQKNSDNGIHLTFIGIGVDFNTELIEAITKIRGANYYSVHSSKEFKKTMDDDFEFMVTPLVFDLELVLEASGYDIEKVYGSPEANEATGEIMKVNTLFPSRTEEGETKGGIILLKLKRLSADASLKLKVSYEDREGKEASDEKAVVFGDEKSEFFQNSGIRKAIVLSRYADLMKNWMIDEAEAYEEDKPIMPRVTWEDGIVVPIDFFLGEWERQSIPLVVSEHYADLFVEFAGYFSGEMDALDDDTLSQEYELLEKLSNY